MKHSNSLKFLIFMAILAFFGPRLAFADTHDHRNPDLAKDSSDYTYIVWLDLNVGSSNQGNIFMQKYDRTGIKQWANDVQVNVNLVTWPTTWFPTPRVAIFGPNVYILWARGDLFMQRFDPDGNRLWGSDMVVNADQPPEFIGYDLDVDSVGFIYVHFQRIGSSGRISFCQKVDSSGQLYWPNTSTPSDISCGQGSSQTKQVIAVSDDDSIYVMNSGGGNWLRRMDTDGNTIWHSVNTGLSNFSIDTDSVNNVVISGTSGGEVLIQKYDPDGNPIFPAPLNVSSGADSPDDTHLDVGNFDIYHVTWIEERSDEAFDTEVYFNKTNTAGVRVHAQDINAHIFDIVEQEAPRIVADGALGSWIAWFNPITGNFLQVFRNHLNFNGNRIFDASVLVNEDCTSSLLNQPPILNPINNPLVFNVKSKTVTRKITAFDLEDDFVGDPLIFSITALPAGVTFETVVGEPNSRIIRVPKLTPVEDKTVTITVEDSDGDTDVQIFLLRIIQRNRPRK